MFCRLLFVFFLSAIVLSLILRYTDSDYPFDIFKLFLLVVLRLAVLVKYANIAKLKKLGKYRC